MMRYLCTHLLVVCILPAIVAITYETSNVNQNRFKNFIDLGRTYLPYGPDLTLDPPQPSTEPFEGFGFGLRGIHNFVYDKTEKYIYALSKERYVVIVDFYPVPMGDAIVTEFSLDFTGMNSDVGDIAICNGFIFISFPNLPEVHQYETVKRSNPKKPVIFDQMTAGHHPETLSASPNCNYIAVANEGRGSPSQSGEIHLITDFTNGAGAKVEEIQFAGYTDAMLLNHGVHMPLTQKAMEYWDLHSHSANEINWADLRQSYAPDLFMSPGSMSWSTDETHLFVNLQKHSAVIDIDVDKMTVESIRGYGLKRWFEDGIDIVQDGGCGNLATNPALYTLRAPSQIVTAEVDGTLYLLTADTGSSGFSYQGFQERTKAGAIFRGTEFNFRNGITDPSLFDETNPEGTGSASFNRDCITYDPVPGFCASDLQITLGSSAVNYEANVEFPTMNRIVGFGGRGMSIFTFPQTGNATLHWDSGDLLEKEGCEVFPWAHNGVQNELFASTTGPLYALSDSVFKQILTEANDPNFSGCQNRGDGAVGACPISKTVDTMAPATGLAPQSIAVGTACGRLMSVVCAKNNANCYLFDISTIGAPTLEDTINLSTASRIRSPEVAYDINTLGEIDPTRILFLSDDDSPFSRSVLMISGALSSSIIMYEIGCTISETAPPAPTPEPTPQVPPTMSSAPTPFPTPTALAPMSSAPTPFPTPTALAPMSSAPTPFPSPAAFGQSPTRNPVLSSINNENSDNDGLSGGAIAGTVIAVVLGGVLMMVGIIYWTSIRRGTHIEELDASPIEGEVVVPSSEIL